MNTAATADAPAIDETAIAELERGLPGGDLGAALQAFCGELEKQAALVGELVDDGDPDDLALLAHGLKGSAATFCAPSLADAASIVEEQLAGHDAAAIHAALLRLSAELGRTLTHLRRLLERRNQEQP